MLNQSEPTPIRRFTECMMYCRLIHCQYKSFSQVLTINYIFSTFPKYLFFIGTKIPTKHNNLIKPSQVDYFQNNIQLYHCKTNKFMSQSFITWIQYWSFINYVMLKCERWKNSLWTFDILHKIIKLRYIIV